MDINYLLEVLRQGVSPFHCVSGAKEQLIKHGCKELFYKETWDLQRGEAYVIDHYGTSLFAFTIGKTYCANDMFRVAAAHTDYPCLRIKPNPDFAVKGYAQVNLEVYGGPILNTWLDRPLGVAGRVMLKSEDPFHPKSVLYRSKKPVLTIPNLAIHMNREVNKGIELNAQTDLMPIIDMLPAEQKQTGYFMEFLAQELQVEKDQIMEFELNTYIFEEPVCIGAKETLLSSPRLDNQTSVSALLEAFQEGKRTTGINLIALFDHEEIGNQSKQGAQALFLRDLMYRILRSLALDEEQIEQSLYESMMLSVDVAHGLHPNKQNKMDITNQPVLGNGFCIKEACSQSYATDALAITILRQICEQAKIPYQCFVNRSDVRGGGTLGSVMNTRIPAKTVDIGIPLLAMHSARELMGIADYDSLRQVVQAFFEIS